VLTLIIAATRHTQALYVAEPLPGHRPLTTGH
jgi:hypothetical protein